MPASILDLVEDAAAASTTRVLFGAKQSEARTVGDLWLASERAAGRLAHLAAPGGAVALVLSPTAASVTALLGAWRAGLTVGSLHLPSRAVAGDEYLLHVEGLCRQLGAGTIVVGQEHAHLVDLDAFEGAHMRVVTAESCLEGGPRSSPPSTGPGRFVQFTSGTTGPSRGVRLSLEAIGANAKAMIEAFGLRPGYRICSWLPLSHDMGLVSVLLTGMAAGGRRFAARGDVVLLDPRDFMADPSVWLAACSDLSATVTVSASFGLELAVRTAHRLANHDLSALEACVVGAERIRAESLRRFTAMATSYGLPRNAVLPAYGLAEATVGVSLVEPGTPWRACQVDPAALADARWLPTGSSRHAVEVVSCGKPFPGVAARVATGTAGEVGEIQVSGPSLCDGYLDGTSPATADGWLRTSDLGTIVDGELYVIGRGDDFVVAAGTRIYAPRLEDLAMTHGAVRKGNCVVVALAGGHYALVAEPVAVTHPGGLQRACRDLRTMLAQACGVSPKAVAFVERGSLAKTPSGKLQRVAIASALEAGTIPVTYRHPPPSA